MKNWTYDDTLKVLELYIKHGHQIPHEKNEDVITLSENINIPPSSIKMKCQEFQYLDTNGKKGLSNFAKTTEEIWKAYTEGTLKTEGIEDREIYKIFKKFLHRTIIEQKSFFHGDEIDKKIDWNMALAEIKKRFINNYDDGDGSFDAKVLKQFDGASKDSKLAFLHIEYLWGMGVSDISIERKLLVLNRWPETLRVENVGYILEKRDCIGNSGMWHKQNKYVEFLAIIKLFDFLANQKFFDINEILHVIEQFSLDAIYKKETSQYKEYFEKKKCAIYAIILHLSNPNEYESIISFGDKDRIIKYFTDDIYKDNERAGITKKYIEALKNVKIPDTNIKEKKLTVIKNAIYSLVPDSTGKDKWVFYQPEIVALWKPKKKNRDIFLYSYVEKQIAEEKSNISEEGVEGECSKKVVILKKRNQKVADAVKKRDGYKCQACGFNYGRMIVEAHHLDPISKKETVYKVTDKELLTLCPNCHRIAHLLVNKNSVFIEKISLLLEIEKINAKITKKTKLV
jgi:predicted HNH restriction endonuclease